MKNLTTILFLILSIHSFSQQRATLENLQKDKEICTEFAQKSITELGSGILLVRLDFRQREIDYYEKYGNTKAVENIKKQQAKINEEIVEAFREEYHFGDVYFFQLSDSRKILDQDFDSVTFYNDSLQVVNLYQLKTNNYLIAEFGQIRQDTTYYYSDNVPDTREPNPNQVQYYGGTKNTRAALIIMDRNFNQIREPFPYFAVYHKLTSVKSRYHRPVEKMSERLMTYYKKTLREKE